MAGPKKTSLDAAGVGRARAKGRQAGGDARLRIAGRSTTRRDALALDSINHCVYDWEILKDKIYYSPRLRAVFGMRDDQMLTPEESTSRLHPDDLPAYRAALVAHLKGDDPALRLRIPLSRQSASSGAGRARAASRSAMQTASPTA